MRLDDELNQIYEFCCRRESDIHEHLPVLRALAKESSTVVEIGVRGAVSTWGILLGLSESLSRAPSYVGIDCVVPEDLFMVEQVAKSRGIAFSFREANDMDIDIEPTDLLFIDSFHTYFHLTYELEKFSSKVAKYIALHDTSGPWGYKDEPASMPLREYPAWIDRTKQGLWSAVEDFLARHPEWSLHERRINNHGLTVLKRNNYL